VRWRGPKKNGSECPSAAALDAHTLADYYEALRKTVVESGSCAYTMAGHALLVFKGMAAWMKGMSEAPAYNRAPVAPRNESSLPVGIEQNLVDILATMVLAGTLEGMA
jgi:hypothetical protein